MDRNGHKYAMEPIDSKITTTTAVVLNDINIQYRFQQMGVILFLFPMLLLELPNMIRIMFSSLSLLWNIRHNQDHSNGTHFSQMSYYIMLSLCNGIAFTLYNLASTYILTRISVIQHAILNCIRRIFAIVVTSIVFHIPMTLYHMIGILFAISGFLSFTHFKIIKDRKQQQQQQHSTISEFKKISRSSPSSAPITTLRMRPSIDVIRSPASSATYIPLPSLLSSSTTNNTVLPSDRTIPLATTTTSSSSSSSRRRKQNNTNLNTII
jgi:multidrug transporter EmrE-like cation transporter